MLQKERFMALVQHMPALSWATIDEIIAACDQQEGFWEEEWLTATTLIAKKSLIRKHIRDVKDTDGMPLWHSLVTKDEDGREVHKYKQEVLFDQEDYLQVINYYVDRSLYTMRMAEALRDRAVKRYDLEQLALPWE